MLRRTLLEVNGAALGESYKKLFGAHEELAKMVDDCLQTGTVYRRNEIEAVSENGKLRRLGATVAPIDLPPERGPRGALCLLTDITEVTELREQVALKNNLESLGEMSAGLAHEFKNAIATLQGYAQLLQSLELNDKAQVAAASLLNEVRNLSSMVTAFLNFARPQPLHLVDVCVSELIADCAAELRLKSVINVDASLAVRADERMLRLALLNLMRNGAEANPDGEVFVSATREDGTVMIQVRDNGPGSQPLIFKRSSFPSSPRRQKVTASASHSRIESSRNTVEH